MSCDACSFPYSLCQCTHECAACGKPEALGANELCPACDAEVESHRAELEGDDRLTGDRE